MANHQLKKIDHTAARHAEVKRRYAWQAQQRRKQSGEKPDQARLLTLIRLRELERIFKSRYGRFLPNDDAGLDDLTLAAHHIAHLRGEVIEHIVAWAHAWAPWLPQDKAEQLAERVAAQPRRFTADALAWRLRLSMAERTDLKVTTIGAFDMSKAERLEERKRKRREAERARRAKNSSGRPRGRPRKMRGQQVERILAATDFRQNADAAREAPEHGSGIDTSKNQINASDAAQSQLSGLGKGQSAVPPSTTTRASPQMPELTKPPVDIVDEAIDIARQHPSMRLPTDRSSVQRMLERLWPSHVKSRIAFAKRYYGQFNPERDLRAWHSAFRTALDNEAGAIERYRERRRKWQQKQATPVYTRRTGSIFETDAWKRHHEQEEVKRRRDEMLERLASRRLDRMREIACAGPSRIVWPAPGFVVPPEELPL